MNQIKCKSKTIITGILAGLANGLFGSGGGSVLVPCLVFWNKIEDHRAHATAIAVILPLTIISSYIYIKNSLVDYDLTYKVTIGSMLGAYVGSTMLNSISSQILKRTFGIFMIIAAFRMLF